MLEDSLDTLIMDTSASTILQDVPAEPSPRAASPMIQDEHVYSFEPSYVVPNYSPASPTLSSSPIVQESPVSSPIVEDPPTSTSPTHETTPLPSNNRAASPSRTPLTVIHAYYPTSPMCGTMALSPFSASPLSYSPRPPSSISDLSRRSPSTIFTRSASRSSMTSRSNASVPASPVRVPYVPTPDIPILVDYYTAPDQVLNLYPGLEPWIRPPPIVNYPGSKRWVSYTLTDYQNQDVLVYTSMGETKTYPYQYFDRESRICIGLERPLAVPPGCLDIHRFGIPFPKIPLYARLHPSYRNPRGKWLYLSEYPQAGDVGRVMHTPQAGMLPPWRSHPIVANNLGRGFDNDDDVDYDDVVRGL
jgi:hypothetical protein